MEKETPLLCPCGGLFLTAFSICCDVCDTWYHGNCAHVTVKETKTIDKFVCEDCHEKWPHHVTTYLSPTSTSKLRRRSNGTTSNSKPPSGGLKLSATYTNSSSQDMKEKPPVVKPYEAAGKGASEAQPSQLSSLPGETASEVFSAPVEASAFETKPKEATQTAVRQKKRKRASKKVESEKKVVLPDSATTSSVVFDDDVQDAGGALYHKSPSPLLDTEVPCKEKHSRPSRRETDPGILARYASIHCQGPACRRKSRPGSKYCSNTCGLERASQSMKFVLPYQILQYKDEIKKFAVAESMKTARVAVECAMLNAKIDTFQNSRAQIMKYLEGLTLMDPTKPLLVVNNFRVQYETRDQAPLYRCPICLYEQTDLWSHGRHILKCYQKKEKGIVMSSDEPELHNEDGFICDRYVTNPMPGYCKRVRALCYEHNSTFTNDPKRYVCGAPLVLYKPQPQFNICLPIEEFYLKSQGICMTDKTTCLEHHDWARILIGTLDSFRLETVNKHDFLAEKTLRARDAILGRLNIPDLMSSFPVVPDVNGNGPPAMTFDKHQKLDWSAEIAEINGLLAGGPAHYEEKKLEKNLPASVPEPEAELSEPQAVENSSKPPEEGAEKISNTMKCDIIVID